MPFRIDTQNLVTTIISAYEPQENNLFEEKTEFYDAIVSSSVPLLFEYLPCWASEIKHFEIFSHP